MATSSTSWKKGISPNPGGRPAGFKAVRDKALALSLKGLDFLEKVIMDENEPTRNRLTALNMALDRGLGKPSQTLQIQDEQDDLPPSQMTAEQLKRKIEAITNNKSEEILKSYIETVTPNRLREVLGDKIEDIVTNLHQDGKLQPILENLNIKITKLT